MRVQKKQKRRTGATMVEVAMVLPVVFLLLFGIIVGAAGIFAYQQVSALAREGSRYASVHGTRYSESTGNPIPTAKEIYRNGIKPRIVTLDPNKVTTTITWPNGNRPGQKVIVEVRYLWSSTLIFGDLEFVSTSTKEISW